MKRLSYLRATVLALPIVGIATAAPAARAQETGQKPPARQIVNRHVRAIGGADALTRRNSWKATGTFAVPASGLQGALEVWQSAGRSVARIELPGIGELLRGFDGTVGWSVNPIEGPRVLDGMELAQAREEASRGASLRDTTVVRSLETLEQTTMNSQPCWRVKVVWKSGRETFDCYSVESGLLVATAGKTTTPMGEIEYTTLVSDYKKFGDLMIPTRVVQTALGQEQIVTTTSVEYQDIPDSRFALPEAIKALAR